MLILDMPAEILGSATSQVEKTNVELNRKRALAQTAYGWKNTLLNWQAGNSAQLNLTWYEVSAESCR